MDHDASAGTFGALARSRLLRVIAGVTSLDEGGLADLAELMLHRSAAPGGPRGQSDLSSNGSPLQALFSARGDRWVARLVADPAFDRRDPVERLRASRKALAASLAAGGSQALGPLVETMLESILPASEVALRGYPTGMIRLGVALGAPGAAVYAGPDPHGSPWEAAMRWVRATFADPRGAARLVEALAPGCSLLGAGVEGVSPEGARAKIYWRLAREASLRSFGVPLFESPAIIGFLKDILGGRELPLEALSFSAGFAISTGELRDVKIDVARGDLGPAGVVMLVNQQARRLRMAPPPLHGLLDRMNENDVGAACVGIGLDVHGERRINTYLHAR